MANIFSLYGFKHSSVVIHRLIVTHKLRNAALEFLQERRCAATNLDMQQKQSTRVLLPQFKFLELFEVYIYKYIIFTRIHTVCIYR